MPWRIRIIWQETQRERKRKWEISYALKLEY